MDFLDSPGKRRQKRIKRTLYLLLAAVFVFAVLKGIASGKSDTIISPVPSSDQPENQNVLPVNPTGKVTPKPVSRSGNLTEIVKKRVGSAWTNYSVVVSDYNSGYRMAIADAVIYDAASVNKIPILAALYSEVEKGNIDLEDTITLQAKDIQDYGTGSMRYAKPGTVYSIKTTARIMISQSDNTAAYIIANHIVGLKKIQEIVNGWGMTQTDMFKNTTSNADIEKLVRMIFDRKITGDANTREMLSFFTKTEFEDRLPALLPEQATVYHKIGTEVRVMHDAGVVEYGTNRYYVGIFVGDAVSYDADTALMAQLSRDIFDFMTGS